MTGHRISKRQYAFMRKGSTIFLAFCFFTSLLLGIFVSFLIDPFRLLRGYSLPIFPASGLSFVLSACCPFFLSVMAILFSLPWLVYLLCVTYVFVFTYISLSLISSFQSIGFYVRFILFLGDFITLPYLYFIWHSYFSGKSFRFLEVFSIIVIGFLIGMVEYSITTLL